jgi:hypothetical protein
MRRELLVLWIAATAPLFTQSITGRSFGTDYHPSKSGVAGTKIFVTNTAQGWRRETVTDKTGNYTIARLPPGPYKVGVSAAGFLLVDQPTRVDTTLQPGTITEQITVTARAPLIVEGDSKATRHVVNTRNIRTLPLNGRRFFDLAEADLAQKAYAALPVEESYAFHKALSEWREPQGRDTTARAVASEPRIGDRGWRLLTLSDSGVILQTAAEEFGEYLERPMQVQVTPERRAALDDWEAQRKVIAPGTREQLPTGRRRLPTKSEMPAAADHELKDG